MNKIQVQIIITSIRSRADGSLGFSATTPELTVEQKVEFMKLQNEVVEGVFIPIDAPNAPEYKINSDLESKTPSQRLRNVLYILHQQLEVDEDFEGWYKVKMNSIIEGIKNKLE